MWREKIQISRNQIRLVPCGLTRGKRCRPPRLPDRANRTSLTHKNFILGPRWGTHWSGARSIQRDNANLGCRPGAGRSLARSLARAATYLCRFTRRRRKGQVLAQCAERCRCQRQSLGRLSICPCRPVIDSGFVFRGPRRSSAGQASCPPRQRA